MRSLKNIVNPLKVLSVSILMTSAALSAWADISPTWSFTGAAEPESALVSPEGDVIYISNMNGQPLDDNGTGYISKLSVDGRILEDQWITGLGAPKGMAVYQHLLYVADLQTLHIIDRQQGRLLNSIKVYGSKLLNDIAVDNHGVVYITDMLAGGIYRLKDKHISQWISSDMVPHPNGIFFDGDKLLLATWGTGIKEDFSTETLGSLYTLAINTEKITPLKGAEEFGNLDGIVKINHKIIINDWITGDVFAYENQKITKLFNAGKHASDIGSWQNQLLVPLMFDQRIDSYLIK